MEADPGGDVTLRPGRQNLSRRSQLARPDDAREIILSPSKYGQMVAIVDAADYERLATFRWYARRSRRRNGDVLTFYAARNGSTASGASPRTIFMHCEIVRPEPRIEVDHEDGDGLHNWRENLRVASRGQNQQNRRTLEIGKTSRFKGVSLFKRSGRWLAQISQNGIVTFLGHFDSELDAAIAYDAAARERFGIFAAVNFPHPTC